VLYREVEFGWTFLARSHWGGATDREVKRLMLDHALSFVDTVVFWAGETNWRLQGWWREHAVRDLVFDGFNHSSPRADAG
jgi:hypothetical protein